MANGDVVIVTGAGTGIGRAIAHLLATEGWRVVMVGRRAAALEETRALIERDGGAAPLVIEADQSDEPQARRVVGEAVAAFGRIDALVNNAAIGPPAAIEATTRASLERMFSINTFGPAYLIAEAWPRFLSQGRGRVVNISSMAAVDPFPGLMVYGASKAALESFARSLHNEGHARGVLAFNIEPGAVETEMLRGILTREQLPPEKTLAPAEIARVVRDCVAGRRDQDAGRTIPVPSR